MELFKALAYCTSTLALYIFLSTSGVLSHARIAPVVATFLITSDSLNFICVSFWSYLEANSFCPWLMIFRGRPSTKIILEACEHACNFINIYSGNNLASLAGFVGCLVELLGGPALGIALNVLWVISVYKTFSFILSKFLNRK